MFVKLSDGRDVRVQFVHSSHDLENIDHNVPGTLRQLVDYLSHSLRRRVSYAEIARVDLVTVDADGAPVRDFLPEAQGFALCHWKDQFNRRTGREIALFRALLVWNASDEDKNLVVAASTNGRDTWQSLVMRYAEY